MIKKIAVLVVALLSLSSVAHASSITGSNGSILTVNKVVNIKSGEKITVSGQHFDETVGIYVAMCKVVPVGKLPTPCGGGADKSGITGSSIWISSNPPAYGVDLAKPFLPGGRFTLPIKLSPLIGKLDCRKMKCAIYVRADHLRGDDRSYDLHIPITFTK